MGAPERLAGKNFLTIPKIELMRLIFQNYIYEFLFVSAFQFQQLSIDRNYVSEKPGPKRNRIDSRASEDTSLPGFELLQCMDPLQ